mgnify:CR=1 FL=1
MTSRSRLVVRAVLALCCVSIGSVAFADPMSCAMSGDRPQPGLTATQASDVLTLQWTGDRNQELRLRFALVDRAPIIQELAVRKAAGAWGVLASRAVPDYRVITGLRRMSNQQMAPLVGLGVDLTNEIVDKYRWDPFWDAPLDMSTPNGRGGNPPPAQGVANQPGLPRRADEVKRTAATYAVTSCTVKTDGGRMVVSFPGVTLGVFSGTLQYTIFKGTNLIQQEVVASTNAPWVAYKYHTGLRGLSTGNGARVVWRDIANTWQEYRFGGARNDDEVPLKAAQRLVVAESGKAGAIAVFPPPPVNGLGTIGGFKLQIEDRAGLGPEALAQAQGQIMGKAMQAPELANSSAERVLTAGQQVTIALVGAIPEAQPMPQGEPAAWRHERRQSHDCTRLRDSRLRALPDSLKDHRPSRVPRLRLERPEFEIESNSGPDAGQPTGLQNEEGEHRGSEQQVLDFERLHAASFQQRRSLHCAADQMRQDHHQRRSEDHT